ncbi:MAG TPA: hypothetical protein VFD92_28225 [Candidatus Binatia bacterium]|nr:hypothetical protein [Candidatus Binatia bacterium]
MTRAGSGSSCRARWAAASLVAALAVAALAARADAAGQLLQNGALADGEGDQPAAWRSEAWIKTPTASSFTWSRGEEGIGVLAIENRVANDGGWVQTVPVSPSTWYRLSGWVRSEDVGDDHLGAYLSVMDTFYNSQELHGTQPWQQLSLWVKTRPLETSLRVGCRLGGYSSLNTGRAQFALLTFEAAGTPSPGAPFVYGGSPAEAPSRRMPWMQIVAIAVAVGIAWLLWRYLVPPSSAANT